MFPTPPKTQRTTALFVGVASLIVTIVATNVLVFSRMHQQTLADAQAALLQHSLTLSETIEQTLRATDLVLGNLAERMRAAATADREGYQKTIADPDNYSLLKEKASELPQLDALAFISPSGEVLNISRTWPAPALNFANREDFPLAKSMPQSKSSFITLQHSRITKDWLLVLTRGAAADRGAFLGEVDAAIKLAYFEALFSSTSLGDGYAVSLMRQDGTLLARYPTAGEIGKHFPASVLQALSSSRSAISRAISPVDGERRIAAAYKLKSYPLIVVATRNERQVFAAVRATVMIATTLSALAIFAVTAAAFAVRAWLKQQEQLFLSEERRLFAVEAAAIGTWDYCHATGETSWSEQLRTIIGAGPAVLANRPNFMNQVFAPDRHIIHENETTDSSCPHDFRIEFRVLIDGDKIRWISASGRKEFDKDGRPLRLRGAIQDITAQKAAEMERDELRRRLLQAQETERLRLSQELHDDAGQRLAAILMRLERLSTSVSSAARVHIRSLRDELQRMGKALHHVAWELRPPSIDELGLKEALSNYIQAWSEQTGIDGDLYCSGDVAELTEEIRTSCYRIVQEALTNVAKHAQSARGVSVVLVQCGDEWRLTIEDDGGGFVNMAGDLSRGTHRHGLGLAGIRERLAVLGGELTIETSPMGTTLFIRMPLRRERLSA